MYELLFIYSLGVVLGYAIPDICEYFKKKIIGAKQSFYTDKKKERKYRQA